MWYIHNECMLHVRLANWNYLSEERRSWKTIVLLQLSCSQQPLNIVLLVLQNKTWLASCKTLRRYIYIITWLYLVLLWNTSFWVRAITWHLSSSAQRISQPSRSENFTLQGDILVTWVFYKVKLIQINFGCWIVLLLGNIRTLTSFNNG